MRSVSNMVYQWIWVIRSMYCAKCKKEQETYTYDGWLYTWIKCTKCHTSLTCTVSE